MSEYRAHVLICGGTGCTSSRSKEIKQALEEKLEELGLDEEVKVTMTGCFGLCEAGPIMISRFFNKMSVYFVKSIVQFINHKNPPYL